MSEFYVPVALTDLEAIAVKSACAAVVTSAPDALTPDRPLFTGMLRIEEAYREARVAADQLRSITGGAA
jgi:hypothetical protein